jgi:hypothetical protein
VERVFTTVRKKRTVENESWFYHIFRKNCVLVHAKTTTSYDTVENALIIHKNINSFVHRQVVCAASIAVSQGSAQDKAKHR